MNNSLFIRAIIFFLAIVSLSFQSISIAADEGQASYITDPITGTRYVDHPPKELLAGYGEDAIHELLEKWQKIAPEIKSQIRKHYECRSELATIEEQELRASENRTQVAEAYNQTKDTLKRMLIGAVGTLGLQTAVVITDSLSDLQIAYKKIKEHISGTKTDMRKARIIAEYEALKEKAVNFRKLADAQRQALRLLEQSLAQELRKSDPRKQISEWKPRTYLTKKMGPGMRNYDQYTGVPYFSPSERVRCQVHVKDGKLVDYYGKPVDTSGSRGTHMRPNRAIFVMDKNGDSYILNTDSRHNYHHSTLTAGGEVAAAGEIEVFDGRITYIDPNSGHYLPDPPMMQQFVDRLKEMGLDITTTVILYTFN